MGAVGSVGPAGVTLQFAIARRALGSCATVRELNLRPPPNAGPAAPRCGSEISHWPIVTSILSRSRLNERAPHREHCCGEIAQDHCGLDANNAVAGAHELSIAACIRGHAVRVIAAIDLDDEACAGRVEVGNEAEQRDLPPEGDTELA